MARDSLLVPTQSVMDASTFVARVKAEIHRARDLDEDAILRAMCSALEHYKTTRFWFNEAKFTMLTVDSQSEYGKLGTVGVTAGYGYPSDLLRLDYLRITVSGSLYSLKRVNYQYLRDIDVTSTTGYPSCFAFYAQRLILYPAPNADDLLLNGDYVKDVGTPICIWDGSDWVLKDENGNTVGLTWTSPMLQNCEELIRHRVKADIYANYVIDIERANACRQQEAEALDRLASRTDWVIDPGAAQGWY